MEKPAQWALVAAAWFLAITVALIGYLGYRRLTQEPASAPVLGAEQNLAVGETAICPVTKEKLVIGADTPHLVYQGRVYYFSTALDPAGRSPKTRFLMAPGSFLGLPEEVPVPTAIPTAVLTSVPTPSTSSGQAPRTGTSTAKP